jgi:lipoprotein LprG
VTALWSAPYDGQMRLAATLSALIMSAIVTLVTACGAGQTNLPQGATLLAESAQAMRGVTTTHFRFDVQGNTPTVQLRSAEGQLKQDGSAQGTGRVDEGRQTLEMPFVLIGDTLCLRPPTGPPQKLPASMIKTYFDPGSILNPDRGIAAVLASGQQGATTEAREQVNGVDTYRVQTKFPAQPLGALAPGLGITPDKTSEVWIAAQGFHLVKAQLPTSYGTVAAQFSDYGAPVQITSFCG